MVLKKQKPDEIRPAPDAKTADYSQPPLSAIRSRTIRATSRVTAVCPIRVEILIVATPVLLHETMSELPLTESVSMHSLF